MLKKWASLVAALNVMACTTTNIPDKPNVAKQTVQGNPEEAAPTPDVTPPQNPKASASILKINPQFDFDSAPKVLIHYINLQDVLGAEEKAKAIFEAFFIEKNSERAKKLKAEMRKIASDYMDKKLNLNFPSKEAREEKITSLAYTLEVSYLGGMGSWQLVSNAGQISEIIIRDPKAQDRDFILFRMLAWRTRLSDEHQKQWEEQRKKVTPKEMYDMTHGHELAHGLQFKPTNAFIETQADSITFKWRLEADKDQRAQEILRFSFNEHLIAGLVAIANGAVENSDMMLLERMAKKPIKQDQVDRVHQRNKSLGRTIRTSAGFGSESFETYVAALAARYEERGLSPEEYYTAERILFALCQELPFVMRDDAPKFDCSRTETSWGTPVTYTFAL